MGHLRFYETFHMGLCARDGPMGKLFNCPKKATCPLGGQCLAENAIYQATVIETNKQNEQITETYVGLTAPPFQKENS